MPDVVIPRSVFELADYATHDLHTLSIIALKVPREHRADLIHLHHTMQRLVLYVAAIHEEGNECALRIAARAERYEARLHTEAEALSGVEGVELMRALFRRHREQRSSGEATRRGVGFARRHDDEAYGGG